MTTYRLPLTQPPAITLSVFGRYGTFTETFGSVEQARLRAAALYGDLPVRITDAAGTEYRRYGLGNV